MLSKADANQKLKKSCLISIALWQITEKLPIHFAAALVRQKHVAAAASMWPNGRFALEFYPDARSSMNSQPMNQFEKCAEGLIAFDVN